MATELDNIRKEIKINKSEFIRLAVENSLANYKRNKLKETAKSLKNAYLKDKELTAFTSIDGEDFLN